MCRALGDLGVTRHANRSATRPNVAIVVNVEIADIYDRNETGSAFIEFCEKNGIVWNSGSPIYELGDKRGKRGRIVLRCVEKGMRSFFSTQRQDITHVFDRENMDLLKML